MYTGMEVRRAQMDTVSKPKIGQCEPEAPGLGQSRAYMPGICVDPSTVQLLLNTRPCLIPSFLPQVFALMVVGLVQVMAVTGFFKFHTLKFSV